MKFAILDGKRIEAQPNLIAKCLNCGEGVRSYCGEQIVHHWKHIKLSNCDDWYERETEWHREWKNKFDNSYQEIIRFDSETNEKHIADIYNDKKNVVIEFQHSPINTKEIKSRELFYDRMIWVIDLIPFNKNLQIIKNKSQTEVTLLEMKQNLPKDFEVSADFKLTKTQQKIGEFFSEIMAGNIITVENHYSSELLDKYKSLCDKKDYFLMTWKRLHKRWSFSDKPKFIDIGDNNIYQLIERVKIGNAYVVKRYTKDYFINHYK